MNAEQVRDEITNRLLSLMKANSGGKWVAPWTFGGVVGVPTSVQSGKPYSGGNVISLDITSMIKGYKSKYWNTFEAWKSIGVFPRKGESSTRGFWYGSGEKELPDGTKKRYPVARTFCLFNAEQCHGDAVSKYLVPPVDPNSPAMTTNYEEFDAMVDRLGVPIDGTDVRAAFYPRQGKIGMPERGRFACPGTYYATLAHELIHWSDSKVEGKSDRYAFNELVAEIGSAYLLRSLGLPATATEQTYYNASVYLNGWIKELGSDNRYIFQAASRASKLVAFMLGTGKDADAEVGEAVLAVA